MFFRPLPLNPKALYWYLEMCNLHRIYETKARQINLVEPTNLTSIKESGQQESRRFHRILRSANDRLTNGRLSSRDRTYYLYHI